MNTCKKKIRFFRRRRSSRISKKIGQNKNLSVDESEAEERPKKKKKIIKGNDKKTPVNSEEEKHKLFMIENEGPDFKIISKKSMDDTDLLVTLHNSIVFILNKFPLVTF